MMLAQYRDIDPNRVFLFTESAGFYTMFKAILLEPELWYKAIAILAKVPNISDPDFNYQATYPPILWLHGKLDNSIPTETVEDACNIFNILGMNVKLILLPNTGHYPIDSRDLECALREILQFITN